MLIKAVVDLVESFYDEDAVPEEGVSEETYSATCDILRHVFGPKAQKTFSKKISARQGRYYFKDKKTALDTVEKIVKSLKDDKK